MARTETKFSARFNTDIEYYPDDLDYGVGDDICVWGVGCDDNCYYIHFIDGIFDDNLTEEA
jgi:hypothetical protein